eukprot:NODE_1321_length_908_cov_74.956466_g1275_i0.p1 GENE.NODE_1321_length_908_cov_74.956466_g1275_i0~~NODE_1321_length_908_cov_74.956466_g1275_i0.p1  ORF type:complete len:244 (-),score=41.84 NODE_1321_length_908_cov_74.956466_g1275_i0:176-862(-)
MENDYNSSEDEDYVPSEPDSDSDSDAASKRPRLEDEKPSAEELERKKKTDELWNQMKQGAVQTKKLVPKTSSGLGSADWWKHLDKTTTQLPSKPSKVHKFDFPSKSQQTANKDKIEVTKVYDFAGETLRVKELVDKESKEGKNMSKPQSSLDKVFNNLAGPKKMSTFTKTKSDWQQFVEKEELEEDLKKHNKDGYLEKQAFLSRTDERTYELARSRSQTSRKSVTPMN